MLDLKSWRESSHLALIGIKRMGGGEGATERMRGREMPWLLLMIYCLKCEWCFGGCISFKLLSRSPSLTGGFLLYGCELYFQKIFFKKKQVLNLKH